MRRYFTIPGRDPFDEIDWEIRDAFIPGKDGPVFEQKGVEFPKFWSQTATNIVAQKYFRGRMSSPERESSVRQMIGRVVDTIGVGAQGRLLRRRGAGRDLRGRAQGDPRQPARLLQLAGVVQRRLRGEPAGERVLHPLDRGLDGVDPRLDPARGVIFRGGSGSGVNLSQLRSSKEQLQGRLRSGPVSFMRGADASAGTIKSGGKTRRAAKMVVLDIDHPDVEEFIWCKAHEEEKARVLEANGYDMSLDSPDWASIQYQNANNSIRVTDAFMEAAEKNEDWNLTARTDGAVITTLPARDLLRQAAEAAWARRPGRPVRHDDQLVAHAPEHEPHQRPTRARSTCRSTTARATSRRST